MTTLPPLISKTIFDDLAVETTFCDHIRQHHRYYCYPFCLEPVFNEKRLSLVYQAYANEKEQLRTRLPKSSRGPDHFKLAGMLVFWLRRLAIVNDFHQLYHQCKVSDENVLLLKQYESELPAFNLGYSLCNFFEKHNVSHSDGEYNAPDIDHDYLQAICYIMKFKNISPHAMGMIYKSLYVQFTR